MANRAFFRRRGLADEVAAPTLAKLKQPKTLRRVLLTAGPVLVLAGALFVYVTGGRYISTDDAYVQANLVYVNAQVGGTVTALGADDNQPVKAGQTLITLDHSDAAVALADASAQLGLAVRQVREQQSAVDEGQSVVAQRRTDLTRASDDLARRTQLAGTDSIAAEDLQHAKQAVAAAQDALTVAEKTLLKTRAKNQFGDENRYKEFQKGLPLGRPAHAREIGDLMAFLASDRSGYTSGVIFTVDGGIAAGWG